MNWKGLASGVAFTLIGLILLGGIWTELRSQTSPLLLPIDGDREGDKGEGAYSETFINSEDDWADDAGSGNSVDFISSIPESSIVARINCGAWENIYVSDVQVGDALLVRLSARNQTNQKKTVLIGQIPGSGGGTLGPTVGEVQSGTLSAGGSYWRVRSKTTGGTNIYTSSIISGTYGIANTFTSAFPGKMKFKAPGNLTSSNGILWNPTSDAGGYPCTQVCCTLGDHCDCPVFAFGIPDHLYSAQQLTAASNIPYRTFQMSLSSEAISFLRGNLGAGTWKVKIAVALMGDSWTDHQDQTVDQVGHCIGMSKLTLTVQ